MSSQISLKQIKNYTFNRGNNIRKRYYLRHSCLICGKIMYHNQYRKSISICMLVHKYCLAKLRKYQKHIKIINRNKFIRKGLVISK